jgi:DNA uptake protein ComE-like DNA-binding protein
MSERHPKEGSGGGGAEAEVAEREPGSATGGEHDERMQHAVEIARNVAEDRATAEILALEDDLERGRLNAAKSLEGVQRRLEEAEAKAATVTVTDMSVREEAAEWLREQRDDVPGEIERKVQTESGARVEGAEQRLADEASRLQQQAQAQVADESKRLQAEFDEQLRSAIAKVEAETEARRKAEIDGLTTELEGERESRNEVIEKAERLAAEADERAAAAEIELADAAAERNGQEAVTDEQPAVEAPKERSRRFRAKARKAAEPKRTAKAKSSKAAEAEAGKTDASTTASRRGRPLDANQVTFEELRELGMSITQATRVIAYRERQDGFDTLDDMDTIPGFPEDLLAELKEKLTA